MPVAIGYGEKDRITPPHQVSVTNSRIHNSRGERREEEK